MPTTDLPRFERAFVPCIFATKLPSVKMFNFAPALRFSL